ncbi:hypothetical protein CYMTET_16278 [Cymbomonas tetramitiformis]|uniref:Uncharacterized protein n=1 Tax=Cymbomonas tetramitiformis TaxID=36881 RepID=A0AAE0GCJ1_9CHLO|nr:hypothetical protein CYMTET_16278 [Cymbomonas tetramitiformis]
MEKADLQGQHLQWAITLQAFEFTDATGPRLDMEHGQPLEACHVEYCTRGFCDQVCFALAQEPLLGEVANPEAQVANSCLLREMFDTDYPEPVEDSGRLRRRSSMGCGLEMLLRNGIKVNKYLYQDISPASQAVARARCVALSRRYPDLLVVYAIELDRLPANLADTTLQHLVGAGALSVERWVMVCGYPCQDLSRLLASWLGWRVSTTRP